MKQIAFIILTCCIFSCKKSEDAPPVINDPKDSVNVVVTYPLTVAYKGTIKVHETHAEMSPEYVHFDTVYAESLNVEYPDSTSVTFYLKYWGINDFGKRTFKGVTSYFKIDTTGVYHPNKYDFFEYRLKGDSLNIRIHQSGGPSHQLDVNFAGIKVR